MSAPQSAVAPGIAFAGWFFWGWLVFSQGVYLLIATMQMGESAQPWPDALFATLIALVSSITGAAALGIGRFLPRWLFRRGTIHTDRWTAVVPVGLGLLAWSLAESIGIYGLMLFFMSNRLLAMLPFTLFALAVFALTTPLAWRVAPAPSS